MTKLSKVPTIQNTELLNKIYTYLLVLFFILVSFRFTFFTNWQYINFTEVYFVLVFSTCCLLLLDSRDRKPAVFRWSFDTDLKICFIIFFGFLGVKLFYSSLISIWGDEISQFRASVLMGPFNGAAFHQQPPLDYFFSFWSDQLFGYSLLAVRAHVYFLTGLNLVFLYGLLRKFQISILNSLCAVAVFALIPVIFQYSIEARPIGLGLLTCTLFLYEYSNFKPSIGSTPKKKRVLRLMAAGFILLSSVGFQSLAFLLTLFIFTLGYLIFKRSQIAVIFGLLFAILLFIPIQLYIVKFSSSYLNKLETAKIQFTDLFADLPPQLFIGCISLSLMAAIWWVFAKFSTSKWQLKDVKIQKDLIEKSLLSLGLFLLFSVLATFAFKVFINYAIAPRYLSLGWIPFVIGFAFFLQFFFHFNESLGRKHRWNIFFSVTITSLVYYFCFFPTINLKGFDWRTRLHGDVKAMIESTKESDVIIKLCLNVSVGCWDYPFLIYHFEQTHRRVASNLKNPIDNLVDKIVRKKEISALVVYVKLNYNPYTKDNFSRYKMVSSGINSVFKFEGKEKWTTFNSFLEMLDQDQKLQNRPFANRGIEFGRLISRISNGENNITVPAGVYEDRHIELYELKRAVAGKNLIHFE